MATVTFDTYDFIQGLTEAGVPEKQARAIADGFKNMDLEHVATKQDLANLRAGMKQDLANLRADIFKWSVPILIAQAGLIVTLVKLL